MSSSVPIAHSGHWIVQVLYIVPLVVVVALVVWQKVRDQGAEDNMEAHDHTPA